ncbi:protein tyrosine phosphatase-like protein [Phlyctema vagabunda]|uniref:Very-long-chain (3R)-3-hydroxyacyl-CoA dehydratase n=1 Tax=Phlyctema vagabunda TaxID=108571 RepID=A0ABR4PIA3_9HELO
MESSSEAAPNRAQKPPKPLQSSSPKIQYLILYNFVSAVLWLAVLGRVLLLVPLVGFGRAYEGVGSFTKWTQTLALLEVVHSATGIVRSPISTTAMQVASRILLVWPVVNTFPFLARSPAYSSMLVAWSVTEVIRYSYFTFTLSGFQPKFISWLRYNTFYVLYPLGISSECWLVYRAIAPAKRLRQEYAWALQLILFIYIPGSYILFTHMMAQRRKVLRAQAAPKTE